MPMPFRATCIRRSFLLVLRALLLTLALVTGPTPPAAAATLREPLLDLRMQLDVPGASVCTVLPAEERDVAGCAGLDAEAVEAGMRAQANVPSYLAVVRAESWSFVVMAAAQPNVRPTAREHIADYVAGMADGAAALGAPASAHGDRRGTSYDLLRVNGVDVIRSVVAVEVPEGDPRRGMSRMLIYAFVGRGGVALVTFTLSPEDLARVRPVAEAIIGTASMPPGRQEDFGQSRAYLVGKSVGRMLGMVVVAGVVVVLIFRQRKRRRGQASRQG